MRYKVSFVSGLLIAGILWGCGEDDRRQARIPTVPQNSAEIRNQKALEALTRAINQSAPASAYARRAALYLENGRLDEALADINEALDADDDVGRYYLIRAKILRGQRKIAQALESAQRAEGLGIETPDLYIVMGDLFQENRQFEQARLYLAKVLQMAPYEGEAFYFNGLIAAKYGDTTRALAYYERALALKPRYLDTYSQLTSIYTAQGNYETALVYNKRALAYFPKNAQLFYGRGLTFQRAYRPDSAYQYYQQAIRLQPNLYQAHFQAGQICLRWRAFGQAVRHFEEVQNVKADFPRIRYFLATALEYNNQLDQALALYAKEQAANPGDWQARSGAWRVQRKLAGTYNVAPAGEVALDDEPARPGSVLDTTRVKIMTIKPRSRFGELGDSTRN
ncbi:tetratricopeptide repeat protein [Tellurirhabdus bombi]|uniref:tetratricopeptide repeat protein n=1 Tax=Tellurirhabdus bombi TaxID=2907205 RepID=UPI001F41B41C|nr:tetratricopeptide repeat protein [Tellurirhabdus bombi]